MQFNPYLFTNNFHNLEFVGRRKIIPVSSIHIVELSAKCFLCVQQTRSFYFQSSGRSAEKLSFQFVIISSKYQIWGFHGCDYEKRHLLGCQSTIHTSQETHSFSTTDSSQLMLCRIWGSHGCDYAEYSSWDFTSCASYKKLRNVCSYKSHTA
jgi:hypothetical protein